MSKRIFISYSVRDKDKVRRIKRDIENAGHRIWIYPEAIEPGSDIVTSEEEGIEKCDFVLIMLSRNSQRSRAVKEEIALTKRIEVESGKKKLLYVRIDETIPLKNEDAIQICDVSNDNVYALELHKLLRKIYEHKNFHVVQTISRYKNQHSDWFSVKLELGGPLQFVREVDYHLYPDLTKDPETKDDSKNPRKKFAIRFDTNDNEIVYLVIRLVDGTIEEIRHFVDLSH